MTHAQNMSQQRCPLLKIKTEPGPHEKLIFGPLSLVCISWAKLVLLPWWTVIASLKERGGWRKRHRESCETHTAGWKQAQDKENGTWGYRALNS
jgi:hypothetical protein